MTVTSDTDLVSMRATALTEYEQLALDKLQKVLGEERATILLDEMLGELGAALRTPQDLYEFSQKLSSRTGFEAAVGAMLGVTAILRGARPGA